LAAWLTSPDNQYFARSYVNRLWGYLMGRGIIEPLDDIRAGNPAANPELLDYLTSEFVNSGFDVRHVIGLICRSRTYQLSIETNRWNEDDQINFSHARARRLPAEVLYDSIYQATGAISSFPGVAQNTRAATLPDVGAELPDGFLGTLGRPARESACECERNNNLQLGPVMALVSGPTVGDAISDPENGVAKLVAKLTDNSQLVNRLFLQFLNRPAKPEEVSGSVAMFAQLESDHAQLVAQLKGYMEDALPRIAEREINRQDRVHRLQAELDVQRELAKLRRPHQERRREARIAKALAALAEYEPQLVAKLSKWEAAQSDMTRWHVVSPNEMSATHNARFTQQADNSIFVEGDSRQGAYRIAADIPVNRITGIRLEALSDERLPNRGPGVSNGEFVVTEFEVRALSQNPPSQLVRSWDFSSTGEMWYQEDDTNVVVTTGMRYVFGGAKPVGIKTDFKEPAGNYLLNIITGARSQVSFTVQWSTANQPSFDDSRSARRTLPAGDGGSAGSPIAIDADSELTGLRIVVDNEMQMLPLDAVRLFKANDAGYSKIKLRNAKADFSQEGYDVMGAIDGNSTAAMGNGWAISPQVGQDHWALFELTRPLENAVGRTLEFKIIQNGGSGDHSLGRFRLSVTDVPPPFNSGLSNQIAAILIKPTNQRNDEESNALLERLRQEDGEYKELQASLVAQQKPLSGDRRVEKLEAELAKAMQPLPIDTKLQQLSRAVAISEEQLRNQRLTIAQDIVWALINSAEFLYNH
jgi:hypothetical protein